MGEQQGKAERSARKMIPDLMAQLQQQASQAGGDRFGQSNAASILQCESVFLTDALHGTHLGLFVRAKEGKKPVALDRPQLRGRQRFGGDLMDAVGEHGIEAEHGAGPRDTHNHLLILGTAGGELEVAAADQIEAARVFALGEQ